MLAANAYAREAAFALALPALLLPACGDPAALPLGRGRDASDRRAVRGGFALSVQACVRASSDEDSRARAPRDVITQGLFARAGCSRRPRPARAGMIATCADRRTSHRLRRFSADLVRLIVHIRADALGLDSADRELISPNLARRALALSGAAASYRRRARGSVSPPFSPALVTGTMRLVRQRSRAHPYRIDMPLAEFYSYSLPGWCSIGLLLGGIMLPDKALRLSGICSPPPSSGVLVTPATRRHRATFSSARRCADRIGRLTDRCAREAKAAASRSRRYGRQQEIGRGRRDVCDYLGSAGPRTGRGRRTASSDGRRSSPGRRKRPATDADDASTILPATKHLFRGADL